MAARAVRWDGCSCPPRCCSCSSWAPRAATSDAGCCRSSRSCACLPRVSSLRRWRSPPGMEGAPQRGIGSGTRMPLPSGVPIALAVVLVLAILDRACLQRALRPDALACRHPHADTPWMLAHIPRGARSSWSRSLPTSGRADRRARRAARAPRYRWCKWASLYTFLDPSGALDVAHRHELGIEDYERTLLPR